MICPYCGHENISGVDNCSECMQDLTAFDEPTGQTPIESSIIEESLSRLRPRSPVIVPPTATIAEVIQELCENHIGCVLVGTPDDVEGIFSERDVLFRVADRYYEETASKPVSEFMTPDPERLDIDASIAFALNRMSVGGFRHLPVTRQGRVVGIISLRDVLSYLSDWYPDLISTESGSQPVKNP